MIKTNLTIALVLFYTMLMISGCAGKTGKEQYKVVGYVSGYRGYDVSRIDAAKLTHINYAFVNIIDGKINFGSDKIDDVERDKADITKLVDLKRTNPDLKVIVSVGGWGWSGNFSDAALTDSSRNRFAESAVAFLSEYNLDGIDLDWEYPNQVGAGNIFRPEDVHNFTLLLACLRAKLDSLSDATTGKRQYLLTIATGGDSTYVANTELGEAAKYLDFINLMTYDYHNGATFQAGHHSNLHLSEFDTWNGDATDRSVTMHIAAGVPVSKINIGVPFYGRRWKRVEPVDNGLYRKAGTAGQGIPYTEVLKALSDPGFTRYYDTSAAAPYLWNAKDSVFISYDDEVSIAEKMKYVKSMHLGGVMFWEYTEDTDGRLLKAIIKGLRN